VTSITPSGWPPPRGYAHGIVSRGTFVFVAGQLGCDRNREVVSEDFVTQAKAALANIVEVLAAAGALPVHVARMTWYVTDMREYMASWSRLGGVYRDVMGPHYPAMTAVAVSALVDPAAKVEIEATAVLPDIEAVDRR
jgi:enamine deaminase RidA (YjgF/YER057c/UK114 family)